MRALGNRLQTVAEMLRTYAPFCCIADIGSDHAYLAVYVMKEGIASLSVSSDINEGPLERGKATAEKYGVNPSFVLSDGFDKLGAFEFDGACICGMGGELIADILKRFGPHPACRLFLQPMTAQDDLRKFLWDNGYEIIEERFTTERGKPYGVICATYTGKTTDYTYADLFLGKFRPHTEEFRAYKDKVHAQALRRRDGLLATGGDTAPEEQLLKDSE